MITAEMISRDLEKRWKAEKDIVKQLQLQLQQKDQLILMYKLSAESMFLRYCDK